MKKLEYPYQPIPISSIKENDAVIVLSGMLNQVGNKKYSTYEFEDPDRFFAGIDFIDHQSTQDHYQQLSEINLLTSPSELGELVKVMAIANNNQMELKGFGDFDRTHLL